MKEEQMFSYCQTVHAWRTSNKNLKGPQVLMNQNSFESTYNSQVQWKTTLPANQRHSRVEMTTE